MKKIVYCNICPVKEVCPAQKEQSEITDCWYGDVAKCPLVAALKGEQE